MQENKTFCIAPWVQLVLRTNKHLGPCCQFQSPHKLTDMSIEEYYNSDWNNDIKEKMLLGQKVDGCQTCYYQESQNYPSMRLDLNRDYKIIKPELAEKILGHFNYDKLTYPNRLELHISNICNLKCLTCNPADSSTYLTEAVKLKRLPVSNKDYQLTEQQLNSLLDDIKQKNIDILDLRGGESMMIPTVKNVLLEHDCKNIKELRIQTNGTIMDDDWEKIFKKFPKVEIHPSIDAFDNDNHYIRYPANWSEIENTISKLKAIPNVNLCLNTTVSNLNFLVLPRLFNWCLENNIQIHLSQVIFPEIFRYTNLPNELLVNGAEQLSKYIDLFKEDHIKKQLNGLISNTTSSNNTDWNKFCKEIDLLDKHRKNSIFDILPELKDYWV